MLQQWRSTFRTLADVGSDDILARVTAHGVRCIGALVHVAAVHAVGRQPVAEGTRAAERAGRVVAAERAGGAALRALVNVHARLLGALREPGVAAALVPAGRISAGAVAADARVGGALVGVRARGAVRVQHVPGRALAAVGAVGVDALPADTQLGVQHALVHVAARRAVQL